MKTRPHPDPVGSGQTYHLLLGSNEPGLLLQPTAQYVNLALGVGCGNPLILRQCGLQPLVLLLQLGV